jgi:RNA polymerase sigma-70 factor (ECF subfamily)
MGDTCTLRLVVSWRRCNGSRGWGVFYCVGLPDYDEFFAASRGPLVGLAFGLTGDIEVARELAQETLVRAWVNWRRLQGYDNPAAWARTVTRNLAANHLRHVRRAPGLPRPRVVGAPGPDRVALATALAQLPRSQAEAVVMHDGLGFSVAEVARELGVPEGTVKSWLSRGRAVLAPLLEVKEVISDG